MEVIFIWSSSGNRNGLSTSGLDRSDFSSFSTFAFALTYNDFVFTFK